MHWGFMQMQRQGLLCGHSRDDVSDDVRDWGRGFYCICISKLYIYVKV